MTRKYVRNVEASSATIPYRNPELAASAVIDGRLLIRGSAEWDNREMLRLNNGCGLISFGTISASLNSNGDSAQENPFMS